MGRVVTASIFGVCVVSVALAQSAGPSPSPAETKLSSDWWLVILTGVLGFIGFLQLIVFGLQARRLRQTIRKMDEIATGQTADMQASIAEWKRVASAMEGVASAMASNVVQLKETVVAAKDNVATSKRIADRTELVGGLQTRAYVAVGYVGLVPQNNAIMYRFEPRMAIVSSGLTPAYSVNHKMVCDFLPFPLPDDFAFPLPSAEPTSAGMIGPRNQFTISAVAPQMYSDLEIAEMKAGLSRRLYVWGIVNYEDAFGKKRHVKFAQHIVWMADGISTTGLNTKHHNDAN